MPLFLSTAAPLIIIGSTFKIHPGFRHFSSPPLSHPGPSHHHLPGALLQSHDRSLQIYPHAPSLGTQPSSHSHFNTFQGLPIPPQEKAKICTRPYIIWSLPPSLISSATPFPSSYSAPATPAPVISGTHQEHCHLRGTVLTVPSALNSVQADSDMAPSFTS